VGCWEELPTFGSPGIQRYLDVLDSRRQAGSDDIAVTELFSAYCLLPAAYFI